MTTILVYLVILTALTPPVGAYMYRVYTSERVGRVEGVIYRLIGVDPMVEQTWRRYAACTLWFSAIGTVLLYVLMRVQGHLPLNPVGLGAVNQYVAFNTATSFATNTNWQAYGGETTMTYLTQMLGLTFQNFVSAAVGMAVLVALIRGFIRSRTQDLGNFWRDTVRGVVYILLPLAVIVAVVLITQGVVQTFSGSAVAHGIQGFDQTIARGPVASQIAIKQLGTNGGGFFNVNSAHPFEGAGPLGNFVELLSILLIPAALCYMFGKMVGNVRQGWAIFAAMMVLFIAGLWLTVPYEHTSSQAMRVAGISAAAPNLEGKELRYGTDQSSLWAVATTDASNGSVNSMHDSYKPDSMVAPMFNLGVGEVIWGGVGSGLYGMLFYVIIAVFIGGLMVGRTPEYLGKKIGAREVKLSAIAVLVPLLVVLAFTAVAVVIPAGLDARLNAGSPWVQRDPLRLPVHGQQQRLGVRRAHGERAVLRRRRRDRDADRSVRPDARGARAGRLPGEGGHRAGDGRDPAHRQAAVRRTARRRRRHHRRAHVLPGARARRDRRGTLEEAVVMR